MRWIWIDRFVAFEPGKSADGGEEPEPGRGPLRRPLPRLPGDAGRRSSWRGWPRPAASWSARPTSSARRSSWPRCRRPTFHREALAGEQLTYDGRDRSTCGPRGPSVAGRVDGAAAELVGRGRDLLRPPRPEPVAAGVRRPQLRLQRRAEAPARAWPTAGRRDGRPTPPDGCTVAGPSRPRDRATVYRRPASGMPIRRSPTGCACHRPPAGPSSPALGVLTPIGPDPRRFWQALARRHERRPHRSSRSTPPALPVPHRRRGRRTSTPRSSSSRRTTASASTRWPGRSSSASSPRQLALRGRRGCERGSSTRTGSASSSAPCMIATELDDLARRRQGQPSTARPAPVEHGEVGPRRAARASRRCGCSSTCRTCPPATPRSCYDAQGPNNIDHRERRGRPAGAGRGVPHPPPRRGRRLPRRRQREQDQPAEPDPAQACSSRSSQRNDDPETALPAVRPRPRRHRASARAPAVFGLEDLDHAKSARGDDLRRGGRVRRGVRPRAERRPVLARVIRNALRRGRHPAGRRGPRQRPRPGGSPEPTPSRPGRSPRCSATRRCRCSPPKSHFGNLGAASGAGRAGGERAGPAARPAAGDAQPRRRPTRPARSRVHTGAPRPVTKPYAVKVGLHRPGPVRRRWCVKKWDE